ncbi:MAG: SprT-like domain-containing protein [Terriglobales bacterium]
MRDAAQPHVLGAPPLAGLRLASEGRQPMPASAPGSSKAPRLEATFLAVFRELKPRTPLPRFEIEFYPFTRMNSTIRRRNGIFKVRLSDLLAAAPEPVIEALAQILLRKLYSHPVPDLFRARYRRFAGRREIAAKAQLVGQIRGRKRLSPPQGRHHDLEAIFEELNQRFFHGLMARPALGWAPQAARRHLGHYDPAHNAILISRVFDSPGVPRHALEYVLYHEMLHLKYPVRMRGSRRCVHSAEFQAEEQRFPGWQAAEAALKAL